MNEEWKNERKKNVSIKSIMATRQNCSPVENGSFRSANLSIDQRTKSLVTWTLTSYVDVNCIFTKNTVYYERVLEITEPAVECRQKQIIRGKKSTVANARYVFQSSSVNDVVWVSLRTDHKQLQEASGVMDNEQVACGYQRIDSRYHIQKWMQSCSVID